MTEREIAEIGKVGPGYGVGSNGRMWETEGRVANCRGTGPRWIIARLNFLHKSRNGPRIRRCFGNGRKKTKRSPGGRRGASGPTGRTRSRARIVGNIMDINVAPMLISSVPHCTYTRNSKEDIYNQFT